MNYLGGFLFVLAVVSFVSLSIFVFVKERKNKPTRKEIAEERRRNKAVRSKIDNQNRIMSFLSRSVETNSLADLIKVVRIVTTDSQDEFVSAKINKTKVGDTYFSVILVKISDQTITVRFGRFNQIIEHETEFDWRDETAFRNVLAACDEHISLYRVHKNLYK